MKLSEVRHCSIWSSSEMAIVAEQDLFTWAKFGASSLPSSASKTQQGPLAPRPASKAVNQAHPVRRDIHVRMSRDTKWGWEGGCICVVVERMIPVQGLINKKQDESNVYFTGYVATFSDGESSTTKPADSRPIIKDPSRCSRARPSYSRAYTLQMSPSKQICSSRGNPPRRPRSVVGVKEAYESGAQARRGRSRCPVRKSGENSSRLRRSLLRGDYCADPWFICMHQETVVI